MSLLDKMFKKKKNREQRSVLFWRNNYYHLYYLACALRKRGWDAWLVSPEAEEGPFAKYYHGQDQTLYHPDPVQMRKLIDNFLPGAIKRFSLFHFSGDGLMCFSPYEWNLSECPDIIKWRKAGNKVAFTIGGCTSGSSQTSVSKWSALDGRVVCNTCKLQNVPEMCNDKKNLRWGATLEKYCDMIFAETLPAIDYIAMPERVYREPLTMCLDHEIWTPELNIPSEFKLDHRAEEILIYHSVGEYTARTDESGRNIKGTPAIMAAVQRLKDEGLPVKLIFVSNMKSTDVRFMQAQADIMIDQLNYGRFGATAREGMMLGKPVICYINKKEFNTQDELPSLRDIPLISATEQNIYEVLRPYVLDAQLRRKVGAQSRQYALEWFSADSCAARYEAVYDAMMQRPTPVRYPAVLQRQMLASV